MSPATPSGVLLEMFTTQAVSCLLEVSVSPCQAKANFLASFE